MRFNDEDPRDLARELATDQAELLAVVMARLDAQDARITQQGMAHDDTRRNLAEMLQTFGDLCYALAEAVRLDRLNADS